MTITVSSSLEEAGTGFADSHACHNPLPPRSNARARSKGVYTRCIIFIVMMAIALPIVAGCLLPLLNGSATNGCLPNGDYASIDSSASFNPWAKYEFLTITVAFGNLNFCTVKLSTFYGMLLLVAVDKPSWPPWHSRFSLNRSFIFWRPEQCLIKPSPYCL